MRNSYYYFLCNVHTRIHTKHTHYMCGPINYFCKSCIQVLVTSVHFFLVVERKVVQNCMLLMTESYEIFLHLSIQGHY